MRRRPPLRVPAARSRSVVPTPAAAGRPPRDHPHRTGHRGPPRRSPPARRRRGPTAAATPRAPTRRAGVPPPPTTPNGRSAGPRNRPSRPGPAGRPPHPAPPSRRPRPDRPAASSAAPPRPRPPADPAPAAPRRTPPGRSPPPGAGPRPPRRANEPGSRRCAGPHTPAGPPGRAASPAPPPERDRRPPHPLKDLLLVRLHPPRTRAREVVDHEAGLGPRVVPVPDVRRVPYVVPEVEPGAADLRAPHLDGDRRVPEGERRDVLDLVPGHQHALVEQGLVPAEPLLEPRHPRVLQEPEELDVVDVPVGVHVGPAQGHVDAVLAARHDEHSSRSAWSDRLSGRGGAGPRRARGGRPGGCRHRRRRVTAAPPGHPAGRGRRAGGHGERAGRRGLG